MAFSVLTKPTVVNANCDSKTCISAGAALDILKRMVTNPFSNEAASAALGTSVEPRGINFLDRSTALNTTFGVNISGGDVARIGAAFRLTDRSDFAEYVQAPLVTSSVAGTYATISRTELNRLFTVGGTGAPAGARAMRFGWLIRVTVPENTQSLLVTDGGAAGTRFAQVNFTANDCFTTWIFAPTRDVSILYGGNATKPEDPTQYRYLLPGPGVGGLLAPGAGTPDLVGFIVRDVTNTQVAVSIQTEIWGVQVTENTVIALLGGLTNNNVFDPRSFTIDAPNQ